MMLTGASHIYIYYVSYVVPHIQFNARNVYKIRIDHFTWGLATAIYVAMVTPILYDNSYSLNDSNLKYESYWPYG